MAENEKSSIFNWFLVVLAALATGLLWQVPNGRQILWPFTLLATWVHEMGHALAAMALADFIDLQLMPDGSGVARLRKLIDAPFSNAFIAAAGLLGPSVAGSAIILFGRKAKSSRNVIFILATALLCSAVFCVKWTSFFSMFVVISWGTSLMALSIYGTNALNFFIVQFIGIQFCINAYQDLNYMFSPGFENADGQFQRSDSNAIAYELGNVLPYWFWGGLTGVVSILLLLMSLYCVFKWEFSDSPESKGSLDFS